MKSYKVWIKTDIETHNFLIWADCMDDAIADARSQLPRGTKIYWTGAQRAAQDHERSRYEHYRKFVMQYEKEAKE